LAIEQVGRNTVMSRGNDVLAILRGENAGNITRADFTRLAI
jgi:hypothetical protein